MRFMSAEELRLDPTHRMRVQFQLGIERGMCVCGNTINTNQVSYDRNTD
jgi:hypothetical protein